MVAWFHESNLTQNKRSNLIGYWARFVICVNIDAITNYVRKTMKNLILSNDPHLDFLSIQIESDRIVLRTVELAHSESIYNEFTKEITRYMFPSPAEKIEDTLKFIEDSRESMKVGNEIILVIEKKETSEFLGVCGLHRQKNVRTPELGIWIKKNAHGNKYGREAIATLVSWAVKQIKFDYLIYPVDRNNWPSRRIPESLGGTIIEEKKVKAMDGEVLDEVVYQIP